MLRLAARRATRLAAPTARQPRRSLVRQVVVPDLGKTISEATVVELAQKLGAAVRPDDVVAVLETDKVTVEVYADHAGTVAAYEVEEEAIVAVGATVCSLECPDDDDGR